MVVLLHAVHLHSRGIEVDRLPLLARYPRGLARRGHFSNGLYGRDVIR